MPIHLISPAKLNLFLHITGQRDDGLHNLQTVFQLLDYGDQLEISLNPDSTDIIVSPELVDTAPQDNLIYKAARLLQDHVHQKSQQRSQGALIHVDKILPMGAGLGGGSSNAGTTLLALNQLWNCQLDNRELQQLGQQIGADVPLFVLGHSAWAEGTGEILTRVEIPETIYLVITPQIHVNTGEIFNHKDLTRDTSPITIPASLDWGNLAHLKNDCESIVRRIYPEVEAVFQWLDQHHADMSMARLTGTGASVFMRFDTREQARALLKQLPEQFSGFVAAGINSCNTLDQIRQQ